MSKSRLMRRGGREVVRIRGNVHKKTMQGRADDFKPLDVVVHGQAEVLQKCALSILIFVFFRWKSSRNW